MARVTAEKVDTFLAQIRDDPHTLRSAMSIATLQAWALYQEASVDDGLRYQLLRAIDVGRDLQGVVSPISASFPPTCPECGGEVQQVREIDGPQGALREWTCCGERRHGFRSWDARGPKESCVVFRRNKQGWGRSWV